MTNPENDKLVEPIGSRHEQRVRALTDEYIARASRIYEREFPTVPVLFDLKGRAAGMYKSYNRNRIIRYNPYIFAKYFNDNLLTTVPHEVAHYVVDMLYNAGKVRPHGAEWQRVMLSLGAEPKATGNYDLSGIPVRQQKRHAYQCDCMTHRISTARHNKIIRGKAHYYCRNCRSSLKPVQS